MKKIISELIGWYGTIAILLAYSLLSFNFLISNSLFYQFLNLTGALAIVYISFLKKTYQTAVLNLIWSLIAIYAIIKLIS